MEDEEDDMDMAAAMGFSSFGGTKKRKYDQTNSPKPRADASGANSTQLGMRTKKTSSNEPGVGSNTNERITASTRAPVSKIAQKPQAAEGLAAFLARAQVIPESTPQTEGTYSMSRQNEPVAAEMISYGGPSVSKAELNALRFGVRNEHGDTAYFLPNFVEDPWVNMKSRQ
jgi:hypothetical protein